MADSGQLLRMLEPAVRPVPTPEGRGASPANVPVEQQSFESLLAEATSADGAGADVDDPATSAEGQSPPSTNLLGPLSQVGAIENASLRALIERGGG